MKRILLLAAGAGLFAGAVIAFSPFEFARHSDARAAADLRRAKPQAAAPPDHHRSTAARWAESEPGTAVSILLSGKPDAAALSRLPALVAAWGRQDPGAATTWFGTLPAGAIRDLALKGLVMEFAADAPDLVAGFVAALPATPSTRDTAMAFVTIWAKSDVEAAVAWIRSLAEGPMKELALANIAAPWAAANPRAAADFAAGLSPAWRTAWSGTIAEQWMRDDPVGAVRWAEQQPGAIRGEFLSAFISSWARREPARAAALIMDLPAGAARTDTTLAVVEQWSQADPAAAAAWVARLPSAARPLSAVEILVTNWMSTDPTGAVSWVSALPFGSMQAAGRAAISSFGAGPGVALVSRR